MARYAVVESGNVTNMVEWDGSSSHPDSGSWVLADDKAHIGGTYDGSSFSAPATPAENRGYVEKRASEYPSVGDQLDMLWHAIDADATLKTNYSAFHAAIKTVKDANPK